MKRGFWIGPNGGHHVSYALTERGLISMLERTAAKWTRELRSRRSYTIEL